MIHSETAACDDDVLLGKLVLRRTLPAAIRSLENDELRVLLLALLEEWRWRSEQNALAGS